MKKFVAKNIGLPLFDLVKGRNVRFHYKTNKKICNADKETIKDFQIKKLNKLLSHANENVPYYKKLFKHTDIKPDQISSIDKLKYIPVLTRNDLQEHWREMVASNFNIENLSKGSSSGSTGVPVVYYKDKNGSSAGNAAGYFGWELSGWEMGMKGLHIWGNPTTANNEWKKPMSRIKACLFNHHKFPSYSLTDEKRFDDLIRLILEKKYEFIDGYTNAIYLLAEYCKSKNIRLITKLKYVLTTAENLQDFQRETIEEWIGPVFDNYGCSEINGIANECQYCREYHIIEPHVIVEYGKLLDDDGSRELIITDLDNFGFPLIRYKNGDAGIPGDHLNHNCKIKLKTIKKISGRQSDIVKLPGGGTLTVPSFFGSMLLKQVNGIKQYQIIRESINLLIIQFVKSKEFKDKDESIISNALEEYLDGKIEYQIKFVDYIPLSENGKHKLLIDKTIS